MAGDWIKLRSDLPEDPAVILISRRTGLDADAVVGKLARFWAWADKHTLDGDIPGVDEPWLSRFFGSEHFSVAMVEAGWLEITAAGIVVPNFGRHNSEPAKLRARGTRNKQAQRARAAGFLE